MIDQITSSPRTPTSLIDALDGTILASLKLAYNYRCAAGWGNEDMDPITLYAAVGS